MKRRASFSVAIATLAVAGCASGGTADGLAAPRPGTRAATDTVRVIRLH